MTVSGAELRRAHLGPPMLRYFEAKLPELGPAELTARIEETLKFLNMAFCCEGNIPVVQEIDDVWHLWILETQEYWQLCDRLHGGRYLHHSSNAYTDGPDPGRRTGNRLDQDVGALAAYVLNYGPFEPDRVRYWLLARHLVQVCGMSVDELNSWLAAAITPSPV